MKVARGYVCLRRPLEPSACGWRERRTWAGQGGTRAWAILLVSAVLLLQARGAEAQDAAAYFKQNCVSCHTIGGGRLVGPDLKDISERRGRDWLVKFMKDPEAMIHSGDAYAQKLLAEARAVVMPRAPGMSDGRADSLLDLIEAESELEQSQFKGIQISDRPFVPADIERGRSIFVGRTSLKNGGAACISCHRLDGIGGLGGGDLGLDLTKVYERLGGRRGLSSWLAAPATPTMQAIFAQRALEGEEILSMAALFENAAQNGGAQTPATGRMAFLGLGLGAALMGLSALNFVWNRRLRGVREPLVQASAIKGEQ